MLQCTNCESAQFLQIVKSNAAYDGNGGINKLTESYVCTLCDGEGTYEYKNHGLTGRISLEGDIEETEDKPEVSP